MGDDDFHSINHLVEFGMSMAVAQQMVRSMNDITAGVRVAGAMNPIPNDSQLFYYVIVAGRQAGPFSVHEFSRLISEGSVTRETLIWKPGMLKWEAADCLPEVLRLVMLQPPTPPVF